MEIIFAKDAIDIIATSLDEKVTGEGVVRGDLEPLPRAAVRPDEVRCKRLQVIEQNRSLLVPVRVELDAALLHQDAAEMFERIESVACEIASVFALHSFSS